MRTKALTGGVAAGVRLQPGAPWEQPQCLQDLTSAQTSEASVSEVCGLAERSDGYVGVHRVLGFPYT